MRFIVFASVALVLFACSKSEPAPSSASSTPPPPSDVARPTSQALATFAVGQWAKYKVDSGEGSTSQLVYKIVGQEDGAESRGVEARGQRHPPSPYGTESDSECEQVKASQKPTHSHELRCSM